MTRFVISVCFISLLACTDQPGTPIDSDSSTTSHQRIPPPKLVTDVTGCYMRVLQRDTLAATLVQDGKNVAGKLTFDNYQKDGSTGTVTGTIEGEIIKLVYRFQSEGMNSISEVYFRITPGGLVHGLGDVEVKADSVYYADEINIRYNTNETLLKLPCEQMPAKYQ